MATQHRTARGLPIDMDRLRLSNESTIAVGNMKVNARGDQLGAGGKVIKTRAEIMADSNKLHNSPMADETPISDVAQEASDASIDSTPQPVLLQPTAEDTPVPDPTTPPAYVKPRGSFADAVAQQTEVTQELLDPSVLPGSKPAGLQRI